MTSLQKAGLLGPIFSNITLKKKKETTKRKIEEEESEEKKKKKPMVSLLVFIMATMRIVFGQKILLDRKGPFGGNVFNNPPKNTKTKTLTAQLSL